MSKPQSAVIDRRYSGNLASEVQPYFELEHAGGRLLRSGCTLRRNVAKRIEVVQIDLRASIDWRCSKSTEDSRRRMVENVVGIHPNRSAKPLIEPEGLRHCRVEGPRSTKIQRVQAK